MSFLKNCWYVAAWSSEVSENPVCQTIIGQPVLLYRGEKGQVIALGDTCPHRFAPLHLGKVFGDQIQCPYHGLRFGADGKCAHNPFDPQVKPAAASVNSYPIVESDTFIWIWMGEPEKADATSIPDFHWLNDTDGYTMTAESHLILPVNYELIIDNLLDLSHGQFLHPATLGNEAMTGGSTKTVQTGTQVNSYRWNPDGEIPTIFALANLYDAGTKVDFWNDMRWNAPSSYFLEVGVTPTGEPRDNGFHLGSAHMLTPIDETHTIYRYRLFRNFARENAEYTAGIETVVRKAFTEEDEPMLVQVQARMRGRDFWSLKPVSLKGDKAAILARRIMDKLLAEQDA